MIIVEDIDNDSFGIGGQNGGGCSMVAGVAMIMDN